MPKYKLALIFGEYNGEIKEFDSIQEREAFRDGVYTGSNAYGRGCVVYTLEEAQNQLNEMSEMWPNAVIITKIIDSTN